MKISQMVFNLQSRHDYVVEMVMFNVQRAITPRVSKPELRFMCPACCRMVLYTCVKFSENIKKDIRVMKLTRSMFKG